MIREKISNILLNIFEIFFLTKTTYQKMEEFPAELIACCFQFLEFKSIHYLSLVSSFFRYATKITPWYDALSIENHLEDYPHVKGIVLYEDGLIPINIERIILGDTCINPFFNLIVFGNII